MADKKISDLTSGSTLGGTEELPIVQSASTVKTTINAIKTFLEGVFVKKGTLTTNTIPKATSSDTIGNSSITDDGTIVTFNNDIKLNGASKRIYTPNEIGYFKATNTNIGFEFIGTTNTAGISSNETQNSFYHDAQNSFDAPLHDFNNSVRLSSLTASTVPYIDASNNIVSSSVTPTQLGYLDATSSIQTQLNAKLSSTKERLLFIGGFAAINPADGLTYYSGEVGASVATTTQSSYKFQFNENCTITRAVIMLRQVTNASNESVSFYLRASGSTDNTITTTLDMNSIGASTNKVFVYSGLNISVTAGTDYENKMLCPTWATNPTSVVAVIKYYGY